MSSVKSLCSKAIIKSDLKRYWWTGAIYAVMIFLVSVMPFLSQYADGYVDHYGGGATFSTSVFCDMMQFAILPALILPVIMGVLLFSYLQKSSTVTTMHAFPIKRGSHYLSHIVSGVILILSAIFINTIILLLYRFDHDIWLVMSSKYLLIWTGLVTLYSFVAFGISVLCATVTGNTASAFVLTYVICALPAFVEAVCTGLAELFMLGFTSRGTILVENIYYYFGNINVFGVILYLAVSVVSLFLGYIFYKARHLENHSAVVAFKRLRPVLIYSFGICIGFLGFFYVVGLMGIETKNLLLMVPFGIVGIIIAKMLIEWSLKPRGLVKPIIIYFAFVILLSGFFEFDISGFERRVPKADDVEYVSLDPNYIFDNEMARNARYVNGEYLIRVNEYDPKIKDEKSIQNVIDVHNLIVANKGYEDSFEYSESVYFYYKLKNARELVRAYEIPSSSHEAEVLFNLPEQRKSNFDVLYETPEKIISITVGMPSVYGPMYTLTEDKYQLLIDALKKDAMLVTHDEYHNSTQIRVSINALYKAVDKNGEPSDAQITEDTYMRVYKSSVNTKALLREWGFIDVLNNYMSSIKIGDKLITDQQKRDFIINKYFENSEYTYGYAGTGEDVDTVVITTADNGIVRRTQEAEYNSANVYLDGVLMIEITSPDAQNERQFILIGCTEEEYNWLVS